MYDGQLGPSRLPACGLRVIEIRSKIGTEIRPDDHLGDVVKSVGGIDFEIGINGPDADLSHPSKEAINPVCGASKRRIRHPKFRWVPQMNARLVAQFDRGIDVGENSCRATNDLVFRFPAQVAIKIKDIVVPDA